MSPKALRGVAIGAGYFSRYQYEAWQRIPEVRITALHDRSIERAYELYDDRAAFEAHLESAHFASFDATVKPWVVEKKIRAFERIEPSGPFTESRVRS